VIEQVSDLIEAAAALPLRLPLPNPAERRKGFEAKATCLLSPCLPISLPVIND